MKSPNTESTYTTEFVQYEEIRRTFWNKQANCKPKLKYYHRYLQSIYRNYVPKNSTILEVGCFRGDLLAALEPSVGYGVDFSEHAINTARERHPHLNFIIADAHEFNLEQQSFDYIIMSELVNDIWDVQTLLRQLLPYCTSQTRLVFNFYSRVWDVPLRIARSIGFATPVLSQNWLTKYDLENLLQITGYETLQQSEEVISPVSIPVLANVSNRYLAKLWPLKHLCLANFLVARPVLAPPSEPSTVSVIVAARNEAGHIDELLSRIPRMGKETEIIFVEGNSTDDTYEVIERAIALHPERNCKLLKQRGAGKGDAVREGFDAATGDILMILDADITVPPEELPRFYDLMQSGAAEFVNGVRLVYPMTDDAMRFSNLIGNKFFSMMFSWLLGQNIRDTLCGTKVLWREDYKRIAENRSYFGDFDPFGDFDLLFGAARLNLKIQEVPVRYRARRYGDTNIARWRHGWLLLKMVVFAARRIKFI